MNIVVNKWAREDRHNAVYSLRYGVEHVLLPKLMYEAANPFICDLIERGGALIEDLYTDAASTASATSPYSASDFTVEPKLYGIDDDVIMVLRIGMPEPEVSPDCKSVFMCHSRNTGQMLYFTCEHSVNLPYMLCVWTEDKLHLNFYDVEDTDDFEVVASIYNSLILKGQLKELLRDVG